MALELAVSSIRLSRPEEVPSFVELLFLLLASKGKADFLILYMEVSVMDSFGDS